MDQYYAELNAKKRASEEAKKPGGDGSHGGGHRRAFALPVLNPISPINPISPLIEQPQDGSPLQPYGNHGPALPLQWPTPPPLVPTATTSTYLPTPTTENWDATNPWPSNGHTTTPSMTLLQTPARGWVQQTPATDDSADIQPDFYKGLLPCSSGLRSRGSTPPQMDSEQRKPVSPLARLDLGIQAPLQATPTPALHLMGDPVMPQLPRGSNDSSPIIPLPLTSSTLHGKYNAIPKREGW